MTDPSSFDPDNFGLSQERVDVELIQLNRHYELFLVWRFIYNLIYTDQPAGLMFLCGESIHYPHYFAKRLASNGGTDVRDAVKDLDGVNLCWPNWVSIGSDYVREFDLPHQSDLKRPYLIGVVNYLIEKGVLDGIPQGQYVQLIDAYRAAQEDNAKRLIFVPLRIRRPRTFARPASLVVQEFECFLQEIGSEEGYGKGRVIFLFCIVVDGSKSNEINVDLSGDDLDKCRFDKSPKILVDNKKDYPIRNTSFFWGISRWNGILFDEFEEFMQYMKRRNRGIEGEIETLRNNLINYFEKQDRVPMSNLRDELIRYLRSSRQ